MGAWSQRKLRGGGGVQTEQPAPPFTPTLSLTITITGDSTINWDPDPGGITQWYMQESPNGSTGWDAFDNFAPEVSSSSLPFGGRYYRIRAAYGEPTPFSPFSNTVLIPPKIEPTAPDTLGIEWLGPNPDHWQIEESDSDLGPWTVIDNADGELRSVGVPDFNVYYRIRGFDNLNQPTTPFSTIALNN